MNAFSIHIPEPCHEDWQQMTPVDKGRFCQSCAKQVVDFSIMTDQEILNYISKVSGGLCGRFTEDQLQRPLQTVKHEKKKVWWVAVTMPLLMLFEKGHAQGGKPMDTTTSSKGQLADIVVTTSLGIQRKPRSSMGYTITKAAVQVNGRVINDRNEPVPYASINFNSKYLGINTDSAGKFELSNFEHRDSGFLEVSAVGYEKEKIYVNADKQDYLIQLKTAENILEPITIISYPVMGRLRRITGCTVSVRRNSLADTVRKVGDSLSSTLSKLFFNPAFKVFPNPAHRGNSVNIDVKTFGSFSIQLFDNSGKLVQAKNFEAIEGATQTSMDISSSFAAGMYYIRLVDNKKKKEYTDKIVVE